MGTPNSDGHNLGQRICALRTRQGMSRRVLANLVGRSEEWLRLVETGKRRLDSLAVVLRLVDVLHVHDIATLVNGEAGTHHEEPQVSARLAQLRRTVGEVPWLRSSPSRPSGDPAPALDQLWDTWRNSRTRYTAVAGLLPGWLAYCQEQNEQNPHSRQWNRLLLSCYLLARSVLNRTGDHHMARIAADRAMQIASGDTLARIIAAWHLGRALLHLEKVRPALDCITMATSKLPETLAHKPTGHWLAGALNTLAAEISAASYDSRAAHSYLARAKQHVTAMTSDRLDLGVWSGPTEHGIVRIHVALRLGNIDEALRYAGDLHLPQNYPVERTTRHHVALAHGFAIRHNDIAAIYTLTKVEQACPEDIYFDTTAHRTLVRLAKRGNSTVRTDLDRLLALTPNSYRSDEPVVLPDDHTTEVVTQSLGLPSFERLRY